MAIVAKKSKKKALKKAVPEKPQSKFISQALVNRKKNAKGKKRKHPKTRGMIFVKNLPHGFFEEQLRGFFTQFGSITRLRLGRSKKTLKSRGYAFIEFRYPEVAEIAADAINNYIMFKRIIKAKYIPPADIRHDYFKSNIFKVRNAKGEKEFTSAHLMASKMNVEHQNRIRTDADQEKRMKKITQKFNKKKKLFADLGMDYDLDAVASDMGVKLKSKEDMTIETLNDTALDGVNDETFDPEKLELASDDEIEELEGSAGDESADEEIMKVLKERAIEVAKNASKQKQVEDKKEVNVKSAKSTKSVKSQKAVKKIVEKPVKEPVEKKVGAVIEKKVKEPIEKKIKEPIEKKTTRSANKQTEKALEKPSKPIAKKSIKKPSKPLTKKSTESTKQVAKKKAAKETNVSPKKVTAKTKKVKKA